MSVEGFGSFEQNHIVEAFAQRYVPARVGSLIITAVTPAELGITAGEVNVPVVAHIRVNTSRHSSEWAIDFIKRGRPFIFELLVNGTDTATDIAAKLVAAMAEYESKFIYADKGLPFTYSATAADVTLNLKDPYLSFQKLVEFLPKGLTYGVKATTTTLVDTGVTVASVAGNDITLSAAITGLLVGDTISDVTNGGSSVVTAIDTAGTVVTVEDATNFVAGGAISLATVAQEPLFDGKYLEENVRMSLPYTSDSYGISPDEKPVISGAYTTITWKAVDDPDTGGVNQIYKRHNGLGATRGEVGGKREALFTLYILEDAGMHGAGGKVDTILTFLEGALGTIAPANTDLVARLANLSAAADKTTFLA